MPVPVIVPPPLFAVVSVGPAVQARDAMAPNWHVGLTARARNVCAPKASPVYEIGEVQVVKGAVSSEHCMVASVVLALNVNDADVDPVRPVGPAVIVVVGPVGAAGAPASVV